MKSIFLTLSFFVSVLASTAFASDRISKEVEIAFQKEFPTAEAITWDKSGDYLKATFILDGHRTIAFFSEAGRFEGSMRSLFFNQLPLAASKAIVKKFENADVIEVYEITNDEGTIYLLTLEDASKSYKVKVDGNGNISESQRVKK